MVGNSLPPIEKVGDFVVAKDLLLKSENVRLFKSEILNDMTTIFDTFGQVHQKTQSSVHYVLAVLSKLVCELSDSETTYKFTVGQQCRIVREKIKLARHAQDMCACLRNTEVRRKVRETDPNIVCICGLIEYRDKYPITHMSYGDTKLKGTFNFPDPRVLYDFILNSEFKNKYMFLEARTETTQAYFDLDFKLHKHGLEQYLDTTNTTNTLKFEAFVQYVVEKIATELADPNYVYSDKTLRSDDSNIDNRGVHLFFPNKIVTKTQLGHTYTKRVQSVDQRKLVKLTKNR